METDPNELKVTELMDAVEDIDDVDELEEMLEAEEEGKDRRTAKRAINDRLEELTGETGPELDPSDLKLDALRDAVDEIDDIDELGKMLDAEKEGEDRETAKDAIQLRIKEITGVADEEEDAADEEEEEDPLEHPTADKKHVRALDDGDYRDMWVYCETQQGELLQVAKEMLGKARQLMDDYNADYDEEERVIAVLVGDDMEDLAGEAIAYGADVAIYHEDERLERFRHKPYTEIVADMARTEEDWKSVEGEVYDKPRYILFPATNNGRDLSAQVQAELDSGLASDCSGLFIENNVITNPVKTGDPGSEVEFERVLHMKRPDFSGFEYSTILCLDNPDREFHPQGCSVIPGSFDAIDPDYDREGEIVEHDVEIPEEWLRAKVTEYDQLDEGIDLTGHQVIVALGRGIGDDPTEGIELGLELADAFDDAELGLSRGVVTASYQVDGHVEQYVSEERQIGETGQVVDPDVYIAAGISGAVQHKVGMDESETIVSINTDPEARIRDFSDYFIEGDLFDVLPNLTEALESGELDVQALADGRGGDD